MTSPQIAVVGAGPAGLAAAGEARKAGARVLLIEERPSLGGRAMIVPGARGLTEGLMRELERAEVWRNSTVWGIFGRTLAVLRGDRVATVTADAVIFATGAREGIIPFPGWTLDGVLTVEGGWEAVRAGRIAQGFGPVIVAGRADAGGLAARLAERGATVTLVAPERPSGVPDGVPVQPGTLRQATGNLAVERVVLEDGTSLDCRMLCVESPRAPAIELLRLAGCPCVYQPLLGGFVPRYDPSLSLHGPTPGLYVAGCASGVDTSRAAAESGRLAASCALRALGLLPDPEQRVDEARQRLAAASIPLHARAREALMVGAMPDEVVEHWDGPADTVICPCEGVTAAQLAEALEAGARTPDELKRRTRCGMGTCQWRRCGAPVMRWISGVLDTPIGRIALPHLRPPARPIPLASLAGLVTSGNPPAPYPPAPVPDP
jgi:bacterioferritin-associated ferredoxin